jgi:hypothetical protein
LVEQDLACDCLVHVSSKKSQAEACATNASGRPIDYATPRTYL